AAEAPGFSTSDDEMTRARPASLGWPAISCAAPKGTEPGGIPMTNDPSNARVTSPPLMGLRSLPRRLWGLSLMATCVLLTSPPGWGPAVTADDRGRLTTDTGEAQESSKTVDRALEDFLRIYRLDRDEELKHVPPPRPEGIRAYWKRERAGFANSPDQF